VQRVKSTVTDSPAGYILTSLHKIRVQLYTVCVLSTAMRRW